MEAFLALAVGLLNEIRFPDPAKREFIAAFRL